MAAFVGREEELKALNGLYSQKGRRVGFVHGGPKMGMTTLMERFCEEKKHLIFEYRDGTDNEHLLISVYALEKYTGEYYPDIKTPKDFFEKLSDALGGKKSVVVFDGNQYPEEFAKALKEYLDRSENTNIVCSKKPDNSYLEVNFDLTLELSPLSYEDCVSLHPKMSRIDALKTYLTVGGVPGYHATMNKSDYKSCIEKNFLGAFPRLCAEAENIALKSSVPYDMCSAILSDMSAFVGRPIDVANRENISRQLCDLYLKKMEAEGLIEQITAVGNSPKKPVYIVKNRLMAFYHTVIRMNPAVIYGKKLDYFDIADSIEMYLELALRDFCGKYMVKNMGCNGYGYWWTKDDNTNRLNVCGIRDDCVLIADCKFRYDKVDNGVLKQLKARTEAVEEVNEKRLVIFSMSGFDNKISRKAAEGGILLVSADNLL
ncbi:MAG: ATP-binding protein [archaeon]|nr:ATP-binding protein [archaeon]